MDGLGTLPCMATASPSGTDTEACEGAERSSSPTNIRDVLMAATTGRTGAELGDIVRMISKAAMEELTTTRAGSTAGASGSNTTAHQPATKADLEEAMQRIVTSLQHTTEKRRTLHR